MSGVFHFTGPAYLLWTDSAFNVRTFSFDNVLREEWGGQSDITKHPVEKGADVTDHIRDELPTVTLTVHSTNEPLGSNQFTSATLAPTTIQVPAPAWVPGSGIVVVPTWENLVGLRGDIQALIGAVGGSGAVRGAVGLIGAASTIAGAFGATLPIFDGIQIDVPTPTSAGLLPPGQPAPIQPQTETWPGQDFVEETIATLNTLRRQGQLFTVVGSKQTESNMAIKSLSYVRSSEEGTGAEITLEFAQILIVETQTVPKPIPALTRTMPSANKGAQNPSDASAQMQTSILYGMSAPTFALGKQGRLSPVAQQAFDFFFGR